ncbi:hypothetical protein DFH29DRAFT_813969 [Suillus ampliporus]|nr:hypothetical protein DFH29DRAFT_813969 [Suillus ampliporus]
MIFLPYAVLLYSSFTRASLSSLNCTCIHTLDVSDSPSSSDTRSLLAIIWSCAATLFACTWTAIHPNIPGIKEGKVAITFHRLFIMVIALVAPELMITWAARQFFSAQWTVAHGYFAWMGGFILYVNDKPRGTLTPYELMKFVREGSIDMPIITKAEIEDRSKGDGLSKGIAILQLVWFVIQLVARYVQHLPITLLEIDTLAVAVLTCIAYGLWWKKPKDVGYPCIVHWKATGLPSYLAYDNADISSSDGCCSRYFNHIRYSLSSLLGESVFISSHDVHSRRVPSLGGYGEYHGMIVTLIGCFSGIVFGGIHCLGWNFLFQRHAEQILWRAASLGMALAPLYGFLLLVLVVSLEILPSRCQRLFAGIKIPDLLIGILACFFLGFGCISGLIYIYARITLVVLMILSLRSLPPGVYDIVAWTKFIPHL